MGWETRAGRRYFYEARREGGRVIKEYIGSGPVASFRALDVAQRRERRLEERAILAQWIAEDEELAAFLAQSLRTSREWIEAAGFHRPGRKPWRKKKLEVMQRPNPATAPLRAELERIKASQIGVANVSVAEAFSDGLPAVIARMGGQDEKQKRVRELIAADAEQEIEQLAGLNPAPVVRLLASRVVACRLHLACCESNLRQNSNGTINMKTAEAMDRRIERAQRMYLAAIKALTDAQRLPLRPVWITAPSGAVVNVGEKQVNVTNVSVS
jgi:hypothetical protein